MSDAKAQVQEDVVWTQGEVAMTANRIVIQSLDGGSTTRAIGKPSSRHQVGDDPVKSLR